MDNWTGSDCCRKTLTELSAGSTKPKAPHEQMVGNVVMTKFDDWPLWLQLVVGVPHALLAGLLLWAWTPLRKRGFYWAAGGFACACSI
jgi:hypothetical protein